jgi:hypothetical protein
MMMKKNVSKPLEDLDFPDFELSPVWVFALDEEDHEDQDETWVKPLMSTRNLTSDWHEAYILLHSSNNRLPVFARIDIARLTLDDIWMKADDGTPVELKNTDIELPMLLVSDISIEGKENVRFVVTSDQESAIIHEEDKKLFKKKTWLQRLFGR